MLDGILDAAHIDDDPGDILWFRKPVPKDLLLDIGNTIDIYEA